MKGTASNKRKSLDRRTLEYIAKIWKDFNGRTVTSDDIGTVRYKAIQMYLTVQKRFGDKVYLADNIYIAPNYRILSMNDGKITYRLCFEVYMTGIVGGAPGSPTYHKLIEDDVHGRSTVKKGTVINMCVGVLKDMTLDLGIGTCMMTIEMQYTRRTFRFYFDGLLEDDMNVNDVIARRLEMGDAVNDDISEHPDIKIDAEDDDNDTIKEEDTFEDPIKNMEW